MKSSFILFLIGLLKSKPIKPKLNLDEKINLKQIHLPAVSVDGASIFMLEKLVDTPHARNFSYPKIQQLSNIKKAISSTIVINELKDDKYDFKRLETFTASKSFILHNDESSSASYYKDAIEWGNNLYEDNNFGFSTNEHFKANIKHLSFEGIGSQDYIDVHIYGWHNNRVVWDNAGGSHHAVALIRQLIKQKREFSCKAKITNYSLSSKPLKPYESSFHIFLANDLFNNNNFESSLSRELRKAGILFYCEFIRFNNYIRANEDCLSDGVLGLFIIPKKQLNIDSKHLSNWVNLMVGENKMISLFELSKSPNSINRYICSMND